MRKIALLIALAIATPAAAMGVKPTVTAGTVAVSKTELARLTAVHSCARKAYDAQPEAVRLATGTRVDFISTEYAAAVDAQRLNNRAAFNAHQANVTATVAELGYAC